MEDIMNKKEQRKNYWQKYYSAYIASGLTQREYCRQNNLCYWTFNSWKRKLEKLEKPTLLQEIPFTALDKEITQGHIEIILSDNMRLSIPDNFSSETLKRVMNTLGELK